MIGSNATGAGGEATQFAAIFNANAEITSGETITVQTSATTVTTVILHCIATGGGETIAIA